MIIILIIFLFCLYKLNNEDENKSNSNNNNEKYDYSKLSEEEKKLVKTDTDGDRVNDYEEIYIYQSNPQNNDSDYDGILDAEEIKLGSNLLKTDSDDDGVLDKTEMELGTNIINPDTDGDGLFDGQAQYLNGKKIAPIDPEPLVKNGKNGIWHKQIEIEKQNNIPTYLTKFYEYNTDKNIIEKINDIDWKKIITSNNLIDDILNLPLLKELASKVLMFRLDNGGTVLHSQTNEDIYNYLMSEAKKNLPAHSYIMFENTIKYTGIKEELETWQKKFGFNSIYDEVFRIATNNNMQSAQLYFKDKNGTNYVLWMWRGDYLALGSGAEIGLYQKNSSASTSTDKNLKHWNSVDFEVPMTLNLYNYYSENNIEHIFSWRPNNNQWWITGFNTKFSNVDVKKQVMIGTVNFSSHKDMYNSLKKQLPENMKKYIIFDDSDSTIWINWYE